MYYRPDGTSSYVTMVHVTATLDGRSGGVVLTDRMSDAVAQAAGQSPSAAAALSALHQFLDRPTIDRLRGRYSG